MIDRKPDRRGDLIVGSVMTAFVFMWNALVLSFGGPWSEGLNEPLGWVVTMIACGALFFRSSHPLTVTIVTMACSVVYYPASSIDGPTLGTFAIALYTLAAMGRILAASIVTAASWTVLLIPELINGFAHITLIETILMAGWFVAIVAFGAVVANYRSYRAEAENALDEARRRSVAEERLRIARELHDAVGHHLSLINVQTTAALRKLKRNPQHSAEETLQVVSETSQRSLRELRATVGVLRRAGEDSPTEPGPSLDQLRSLAAAAEASGLAVVLREDGQAELPVAVDAAAYRVVQEALTNVLRHADAKRVSINVVTGTSTLAIRIADDGKGASKVVAGNGLTGMRERAESLGGTFDARPQDDGGFIVEATWPLEVQS